MAILVSREPVHHRKNARPAISTTISTTVSTTSSVIAVPAGVGIPYDASEEQVVLQTLGEHEVQPVAGGRDQRVSAVFSVIAGQRPAIGVAPASIRLTNATSSDSSTTTATMTTAPSTRITVQ